MIRHFTAPCVVALLLVGSSAAAATTPTPPPLSNTAGQGALAQKVTENEPVVNGKRATIQRGHVDLGPRLVNGAWTGLVRDSSAGPPVWRHPREVVIQIPDAAQLPIPGTPEYAFVGVPSGTPVHVVPQTENPQVPWLGWNTQDPAAAALMGRGAHLELTTVEGPGHLTLFVQDGSFGKPRALWDSRSPQTQRVWADANTHVHANWVFSAPGAYRVGLRWVASSADGRALRADATVRFAVGAAGIARTEALTALPDFTTAPGAATSAPAASSVESRDSAAPMGWLVWGVVGALLLVLLVALGLWRARSRALRDEAELEVAALRSRERRHHNATVGGP